MSASHPPERDVLRVAGAQLENVVGDLAGNRERIRAAMRWAESERADVLVLPELALTGYPLEDLALRHEFVDAALEALRSLAASAGSTVTVVGTADAIPPRRGHDTRWREAAIGAALICDGELRGMYHKVLLPGYEMFDEPRNFAAGDDPAAVWRIGPVVAGVSICEDLWSGDGPPEAQAAAGAQILLVPNASPFHRGKPEGRLALARAVARRNGVPVVYVNCVGGHDELVFDGGSLIVDADGGLRYRAAQFEAERFCVEVPVAPPRAAPRAHTVHTRPAPLRAAAPPPPSPPELGAEEQVWEALVAGTRDFTRRHGCGRAVLGLSGGIDSTICAAVAADALEPGNVLGIAMPAVDSPPEDLASARRLAESLGIGFEVVDIGPAVRALAAGARAALGGTPAAGTLDDLRARARSAILMAVSDERGHLVLATGNKSELSIGSATLYGDMAGTFAPIKDCPKTLLYALARHRNERGAVIPQEIIDRVPTARVPDNGLPPYEELDPIVERYVEKGEGLGEILAAGYDEVVVRGVLQLVDDAEFKRRQTPPGVKITARAFGQDRRMPISNAWRPFVQERVEVAGDVVR